MSFWLRVPGTVSFWLVFFALLFLFVLLAYSGWVHNKGLENLK